LSGSGRAELNVAGGTINNTGRNLTFSGGTTGTFHWSGTGLLNLNAGTLATNAVVYDALSPNASSYVNFNGGTLQSTVDSASFLPAFTPSGTGINRVFVNGAFGTFLGGATIDTNGFNSNVSANLLAPTGNGVTSLSLDSQGSGYVGAPAVKILDNGLPSTATAYAVVDTDSSSANFGKVTNVFITNPGVITGTATVSLVGGGGSGASVSVATTGANTSGGLTKIGSGTLTLNGANTYSGATLVSNGSLVVNGSLASSAVSIASATTLGGAGTLGGTVTVDTGTAQITGGDGTSGTLSTQNLTFSGTGVINVGALGNYAINPAIDTPGVLTLNGGAGAVTLNLNPAPVASGTYRLVRAASGIADVSGFTLGTTPAPIGRQAAGTLQYDGGTNTVTYTTGGTYPIWSGAQSNEWSTNVISPLKNWQLADLSGGTDFIAGDDVRFDNSAAIKTVDISNGDVQPTFANFTNTVGNDYTLQGIRVRLSRNTLTDSELNQKKDRI